MVVEKGGSKHRPFRVHHLCVCSLSHCLIAASSDGRIAVLSLARSGAEELKAAEDGQRPPPRRAVSYLDLDAAILCVESWTPPDRPQLFRAVVAYCARPEELRQLPSLGGQRLALVEWDCGDAQPDASILSATSGGSQERFIALCSLPQSTLQVRWSDAGLLAVLTSAQVLLFSSTCRVLYSTPLPTALALTCATWWGSSLLCASSDGALYRLDLAPQQTQVNPWQRVGSVLPCLELLVMKATGPSEDSLLLAVGDGCDSGVWWVEADAPAGVRCLQRIDSCAPLLDMDICEHPRGDQTQLQLFTASGCGQQRRSASPQHT